MTYTSEIIVNLPRAEFLSKFDNADNMKHWQRGLVDYKQRSEDPYVEGAKMELHYKFGKRDMVLTETIIKRNLPDEMHTTYDTKGVHNIQKNYFIELDDNTTKWVSEAEFQFNSLAMKVMGFLMPGAFKKQTKKYMEDFKAFAEDGKSVLE